MFCVMTKLLQVFEQVQLLLKSEVTMKAALLLKFQMTMKIYLLQGAVKSFKRNFKQDFYFWG